jgi:hypothetical protein
MKPTNKNLISFEIRCRVCDTKHVVMVTDVDVADWQGGKFIQDAFPYLTVDERELIMSQTCGSCWDKRFPEMEE